MRKKLNRVLLIDDSEADLFLHGRTINRAGITGQVIEKFGGKEALEYLMTKEDGEFPRPELIFLDINMPGMNGWEFLEEYRKLPQEQKAGVIVCLLTTSLSKEDKDASESYADLSLFLSKPLSREMLDEVIGKEFPELVD